MQNQNSMTGEMAKGFQRFKRVLTGEEDILSVIEEDHKPLKELIAVMKDADKGFEERRRAFMEFAPLLITHAKAEEKSLYDFMKTKSDLKMDAFEGYTEHGMADQLCEEIKRSTDQDELSAKIKVLAEAVEHHIREEEDDVFPELRRTIDAATLQRLTAKYTEVEAQVISEGQNDSPSETELHS